MSVFIIAELGINHNGDVGIAKKMIKMAKDAGCNAVKLQKRTVDKVYTKEFLDSPRQSPWGTTQREQKEHLEFGLGQYMDIDSYCLGLNMPWFASAWDVDSQKFLQRPWLIGMKWNKIASAMIVCEELLEMVAKEHRHTFISTGMAGGYEIDKAAQIFRGNDCTFELLHCVSTYPMDDEDANLNRIKTLCDLYWEMGEFRGVGYSGHEAGGCAVTMAAVAMGVTTVERHITLDRAIYGSDQASSVGPEGLRQLVGGIRKIEKAMGTGELTMSEKEKAVALKLRAHLNWRPA